MLINPYVFDATDPYFSSVSLLLHGNGSNGSTTITDSSPSPKTITANGNAQISTAQSKFGGASILFDGNGDFLTTPHNSALSLDGDFTIEFWMYPLVVNRLQFVVDKRDGDALNSEYFGYIGTDGKFNFVTFTDGGAVQASTVSTTALAVNTWYFITATSNSSTLRLFINGTLEATVSQVGAYRSNTRRFVIGRDVATVPGRDFNGYIDDLRITKGVARYTANFTPPTAPFPDF